MIAKNVLEMFLAGQAKCGDVKTFGQDPLVNMDGWRPGYAQLLRRLCKMLGATARIVDRSDQTPLVCG